MKQLLRNFKTVLLVSLLLLAVAPSAKAWTAKSLYDYCQGNACELIGSQGNQNSLAINQAALGVDLNDATRKVKVWPGTLNSGQEVLVISNFMGAFDVYLTISGNTATIYKRTYNLVTNQTPQDYSGLSGVYATKIDRVIRQKMTEYNAGSDLSAYTDYDGNNWWWRYYSYYGRYVWMNGPSVSQATGMHLYDPIYEFLADTKWGTAWNYTPVSELRALNLPHKQMLYTTDPIFNLSEDIKGTISYDDYGNVQIQFGPYTTYTNSASFKTTYVDKDGNTFGVNGYNIFDSYVLTLFPANATVTDNKFPEGYNVRFQTLENDPDYNFGITNFANRGLGFGNYNVHNVQVAGSTNGPYYEYDIIKGKITGNKIVIPQQNSTAIVNGAMNRFTGADESAIQNTNFFTFGFDPETQQPRADKCITGTITEGGDPHHDTNENSWHNALPGGTRYTYEPSLQIKLDPYGFTDNSSNTANTTPWNMRREGTVISLPEKEITFDVDADLTFKHNPDKDFDLVGGKKRGYYKIDIRFHNFENPQYVDQLELWYVEGDYSSDYSKVPLANAKKIGSWGPIGTDYDITYYNKIFRPTWKMVNNQEVMEKYYTFFVRAIYKDKAESAPGVKMATPMLTHTHHAPYLHYIDPSTVGVDGLFADGGVQVKATRGGVMVTAPEDMAVRVYNAAGTLVAEGRANTEILFAGKGVYIVKAGDQVRKLMK